MDLIEEERQRQAEAQLLSQQLDRLLASAASRVDAVRTSAVTSAAPVSSSLIPSGGNDGSGGGSSSRAGSHSSSSNTAKAAADAADALAALRQLKRKLEVLQEEAAAAGSEPAEGFTAEQQLAAEGLSATTAASVAVSCLARLTTEYERLRTQLRAATAASAATAAGVAAVGQGPTSAAIGRGTRELRLLQAQRQLLLGESASLPSASSSAAAAASLRRRALRTEADLTSAAADVTQTLRRTQNVMAQEVQRGLSTLEVLDDSNATLKRSKGVYGQQKTKLSVSHRLLTVMSRMDAADRLIVLVGVTFFFLVCSYIVYSRVPLLQTATHSLVSFVAHSLPSFPRQTHPSPAPRPPPSPPPPPPPSLLSSPAADAPPPNQPPSQRNVPSPTLGERQRIGIPNAKQAKHENAQENVQEEVDVKSESRIQNTPQHTAGTERGVDERRGREEGDLSGRSEGEESGRGRGVSKGRGSGEQPHASHVSSPTPHIKRRREATDDSRGQSHGKDGDDGHGDGEGGDDDGHGDGKGDHHSQNEGDSGDGQVDGDSNHSDGHVKHFAGKTQSELAQSTEAEAVVGKDELQDSDRVRDSKEHKDNGELDEDDDKKNEDDDKKNEDNSTHQDVLLGGASTPSELSNASGGGKEDPRGGVQVQERGEVVEPTPPAPSSKADSSATRGDVISPTSQQGGGVAVVEGEVAGDVLSEGEDGKPTKDADGEHRQDADSDNMVGDATSAGVLMEDGADAIVAESFSMPLAPALQQQCGADGYGMGRTCLVCEPSTVEPSTVEPSTVGPSAVELSTFQPSTVEERGKRETHADGGNVLASPEALQRQCSAASTSMDQPYDESMPSVFKVGEKGEGLAPRSDDHDMQPSAEGVPRIGGGDVPAGSA